MHEHFYRFSAFFPHRFHYLLFIFSNLIVKIFNPRDLWLVNILLKINNSLLKYAISVSFICSSWGHSTDEEHENHHSSGVTSFHRDKFRDNSYLKFKEIRLRNRQTNETGIGKKRTAYSSGQVKYEMATTKCENKMKKRASHILNQKKLTIIITKQRKGEWPELASTFNSHT